VFHLIVLGTGLLFVGAWFGGVDPDPSRLLVFAGLSFALVMIARACARAFGKRRATYLQNTVIVGTGAIAQMAARKLLQHPEYGINLVGFVDAGTTNGRAGLEHVPVLGPPQQLATLIPALGVERIVVAFSSESHEEMLALVRSLRKYDVRIDIVPRLFEVVAPNAALHTVEGLPLVGLGPARISRSTRLIKRSIDIVGATFGLLLTAPIFVTVAFLIKRDSPGPVFFRQIRLGEGMREFEILKFRTMKVGTNDEEHRRYIEATMTSPSLPGSNGLYKLERTEAITKMGQWLRKNSLDELPQLINVLRGDMSLVGPRPCIPYETADFAPHHFERFLVPAGMTGLWQVTARAQSSFREALEMDVAYARAFSLGLDLRLLCETPLQVLGQRRTTT
jgi:exopolysaccharide biosynthesis polyprenyl glycosylphosphotransferase